MALPQQTHREYSYAEYLSWDEGRWELINGEVWEMSPAPLRLHQDVLSKVFYALFDYFRGKEYKVYVAPFGVRLADKAETEDTEIFTVVQPDISVICDHKKLDDCGWVGPPDLVVEILSPSTAAKDLKVKRRLYEQHGVNEYWLLHPTDRIAMLYTLDPDGQYKKAEIFAADDILTSDQFDDLCIELPSIFTKE